MHVLPLLMHMIKDEKQLVSSALERIYLSPCDSMASRAAHPIFPCDELW
jgi:hypothetical protein